ncbi:MAG: carbohydrate ABC transporter permease [Caldilineaceae bacterium]|nr:carbohydrate ABC transporter permease [Caldilineaceae bacterium]
MDTLRTINHPTPAATPGAKPRGQPLDLLYGLQRLGLHVIIWVGALAMVLPFLWMLSTSLKSQGDAMTYPPVWIPRPALWSNYVDVVQGFPFELFGFNSLKIALLGTIGQLISTSLAAYAFARMNFPGRHFLFVLLLATLMVPSHVTMIPTFLLFNGLGWFNTHYPLFVPAWFGGAFGTFLVRQFFQTVPRDYNDAAEIDGAGHFRIFTSIYLPLAKPVLATLALFTFMNHWNEFLLPVIYLTDQEKMTLTVGLSFFRLQYNTLYHYLMAGTVLSTIPIFILFVVLQKYFVQGIVMSGLKG